MATKKEYGGQGLAGKLLDNFMNLDYIGRAFFKFKKEFRASYPTLELDPKNGEPIAKMPLSHILDKRVALTDFLGFDQVDIDYKTLKYSLIKLLLGETERK